MLVTLIERLGGEGRVVAALLSVVCRVLFSLVISLLCMGVVVPRLRRL